MGTATVVVLVLVALAVGAGVMWLSMRQRRSAALREHFGPEYNRTVDRYGDPRRAESDLEAREQRVKNLDIRPLEASEREQFASRWKQTQAHFVDDPNAAVGEADRLVADVMRARGYPVGDFEQRATDVSVDHPAVVEHYRAAHGIGMRASDSKTTTEEIRQAMVHYRALFDDLLEDNRKQAAPAGSAYRRIA
jgi:hypothetical protein